jgi:hypothetical protein
MTKREELGILLREYRTKFGRDPTNIRCDLDTLVDALWVALATGVPAVSPPAANRSA